MRYVSTNLHSIKLLVSVIILMTLQSCMQQIKKPVAVETAGIFEQVSLTLNAVPVVADRMTDLGEYTRGSPAQRIALTVKNNSSYAISGIAITFEDPLISNYTFAKYDDGSSQYPGKNGSCSYQIPAGATCSINLEFSSTSSGHYPQVIRFFYQNLVNSDVVRMPVTIYSGDPASLVFEPDETNFYFGNLVGAAQTPLVERANVETYEQTLTVRNAGELTARNLIVGMSQSCTSRETGLCPAGQNTAYVMENINCGTELDKGAECQIKMSFTPKNQADTLEEKEISYAGTVRFDYEKDMQKNAGALNGYFNVVSANIEARFESTNPIFTYPNPVIVGNREKIGFRIKNTGYRPGILRQILVYDASDTNLLFYCNKSGANTQLECKDINTDLVVDLATFPLQLFDKEHCMDQAMLATVPNDAGCLFDLVFQPSITYTVGANIGYSFRIGYDSMWLDNEVLIPADINAPLATEDVDFTAAGSYLAAAKLEITGVQLAPSDAVAPVEISPGVFEHNLGRIALQNAAYENPTTLTISITNNGESPATSMAYRDGSGNAIPIDLSTHLGGLDNAAQTPRYFRSILPSSGQCGVIQVGATCNLAITFVPIGRATEQLSHDGMFDYFEGIKDPDNYKAFLANYRDGSNYTDTNTTNTVDIPTRTVEARLKAIILSKGLLGAFQRVKDFEPGLTAPETNSVIFRLRNIGTGRIPYLPNISTPCSGQVDCPTDNPNDAIKLVRANDATHGYDPSLYGSQHDCADLIDWDSTYAPGDDVDFGVNQACTLKYIVTPNSLRRSADLAVSGDYLGSEESTRYFTRSPEGDELWEYFSGPDNKNGNGDFNISRLEIAYYDFDIEASTPCVDADNDLIWDAPCDPAMASSDGNFPSGLGASFTFQGTQQQIGFNTPRKVIPSAPRPFMSAVTYRPAFSRPSLLRPNGAGLYAAQNFPAMWFYGLNNFDAATGVTSRHADDTGDVSMAHVSKVHANPLVTGAYDCADCEYTIHFGSFPAGVTSKLSLFLENMTPNASDVTITNTTLTGDPQFTISSGAISSDTTVSVDIPRNMIFNFNPTGGASGTYQGFLSYTYKTGINQTLPNVPTEKTIKVQLLADGINDAPRLSFSYVNVDLTLSNDPDIAPVETPNANCDGAGNPCLLTPSDMDDPVTDPNNNRLLLQMVKLSDIKTNTGYVKKIVTIKNESATQTVNDFSLIRRSATTSVTAESTQISGLTISGTCASTTSLAPGASCTLAYKYQPDNFSITGDFYLGTRYRLANNQYYNQNIKVDYVPLTPGEMIACMNNVNCTDPAKLPVRSVRVAADGSTAPSYEINMGTSLVYNTTSLTTTKVVTVANTSQTLRASFLKAWHDYLKTNTNTPAEQALGSEYTEGSAPPLALHPSSGMFTSIGGILYTPLYRTAYPDGSDRILVNASKECFFGEYTDVNDAIANDANIDSAHHVGFIGGDVATGTPAAPARCRFHITLNIDVNYVGKSIINTSTYDDMQHSYFRLPYYSFERSNDGQVHFYLRLTVAADSSTTGTPSFANVTAKDDRTINFTFPDIAASNSDVGDVVGYRVYYSTSSSSIANDAIMRAATGGTYLTSMITRTGSNINVSVSTAQIPSMTRGYAYYFRILAIRSNSDYDAGFFQDLPTGQYFSKTNMPVLRVVVPFTNHAYVHAANALVKKDIELQSGSIVPIKYGEAMTACSVQTGPTFFDNGSPKAGRKYALINETIWDHIRMNPGDSSYSTGNDPLSLPHWLQGGPYNIHNIFNGFPGYSSLESSQIFETQEMLYAKCDDGCTNDRAIGGGFYYTDAYDYESYAGESMPYAQARCYLNVAP